MEIEQIRAIIKLFGAAQSVTLEINGKRIGLGPDVIAEILAALEYWEHMSGER
jgi:hypothetical protein